MKRVLTRELSKFLIGLLAVILCFSLAAGTGFARDSAATRKGVPPLYWMAYETPFTTNTPLTEARWKANVDWFAANFLPYGYDMVSTDGWIEGATMTNANGYILSYNDSWITNNPASETVTGTDTWADWGGYVQSKGLKLGVYYNPLWVSPFAVEDTSKKVAGRPGISIRDIVDLNYDCDGDGIADGDRFNTGQPNPLYWVDVTKPGAEEYVKGYVNYFKSIGAKFLRVDFLSWYENGKEGTTPLTCKKDENGNGYGQQKDHGRANYETALRWMSEAAGDDLTLSLVMPHLYNHGEIEKKYGDMIRIDEDVFGGGWDHISGRRQTWRNGWSQWANPFQGLTGFSDLAGRTSMINDADFLRMNTFSGPYADNERKTAVSLLTMAGAPIAVADQYDTIGSSAPIYQNPEMIELPKSGFAGKPVYLSGAPYEPETDGQNDTGSRDTERWAGQLPNGDWVVGLFNRSDANKTLSMNFASVLGLQTDALVRDLWAHEELGYKTSHSVDLAPHDSSVFKVIPKTFTRKYEAEVTALTGGASFNNDHTGYSAFGFAQKLDTPGAKATFAIEVPEAGTYKLNLRYANAKGADSTVTLRVEDADKNQIASPHTVVLPNLPDWNTWADKTESVTLAKGLNLVQLDFTSGDTGGINLDYIELLGRTGNAAVNPGFETGGIDGWTEWHPGGQAAAYGVDSADVHGGTNKLYFYAASKYQQSIHQTISGLANGTYIVSAWVKRQHAVPDVSRMEISQHGTPQVNVTINGSGQYEQISATVPVTSGTLDVGFYVSSPGGTSLQIDDVRVERADIPLFNSDFADVYHHWSRKGDIAYSKISAEAGGNKYADLYGTQPFTNDLFQYANLTAGTYTLQAKVRRSGTFNNAVIYADASGQSYTAAVPASADWTTVTIPGIEVTGEGEAAKLGFWTDAGAGSWLHIDDVELIKNEPGQQAMGSYVSHAQQGNAVTFTLSNTPKVRIEFIKPEIAKVWMEPGGMFDKDSSFTVDSESSAPVSYTVSDQGGYIRMMSSGLTVRVNKSPFRIDYYDASNTSYITGERSASGLAYGSGTRVYEYMNMDPGERFYGLGIDRDAQSLDRRGKRVVMDNVMSGGYGGNTSDISGTFFTSTKGYGIFSTIRI
ncbi:carbohydrate-binding protein [Paenibacillus beijingensis]|uniref:carbohydrate-binding protein n=1 Tax=Paenibacillus beijingensis TaxID=1126833 RepID=UPI00069626F0|nr:carbohydrate-binding protein [Paenibacillus beijingensis]